jgi:hypothetical protein
MADPDPGWSLYVADQGDDLELAHVCWIIETYEAGIEAGELDGFTPELAAWVVDVELPRLKVLCEAKGG